VAGVFEGNARGYGFLRPDREDMEDVFIPPRYVGSALHGDRVEAYVYEGDDGRFWGEIKKILERRKDPLVGRYNGVTVTPRDPRFAAWIRVHHADAGGASPGDMVMAVVTRAGPRGVHGRVVEVIGPNDDPGIESRIALRSRGFDEEFPADVLDEVERVPGEVGNSDLAGREDLRGLFTVTIDPESARDFDDAISIERRGNGFRLWVSIADVSRYVTPGSAIDREAYQRATSVYLPDRAVHMLPEKLSAGVCSLKPGVDRLAVTVEMDFDASGGRKKSRMYPSVVHSDHRLSYEQVEEMERGLKTGKLYKDVWPKIEVFRELAELRTARRRARGSIDLDVPEAVVVLDDAGEVVTIGRSENTWSHRLVEEFMLAANETVASLLNDNERPVVYRVHEPPAPASVLALADLLAPLGLQLFDKGAEPENISPRDYQRVIDKSRGAPFEMMVKTLCLRSMMQARYSAERISHFGLAADRYCHFTSPIRRYPDLIVHRLLKLAVGYPDTGYKPAPLNEKGAAPEALPAAADHCSERERAAEDAEREMVDFYCALWMSGHIGEDFEGVVSGVTSSGLFVELDDVFIEGQVPAETIDRKIEFNQAEMSIRGLTSGVELRIGDKVAVRSTAADLEQRKVRFAMLDKLAS
jgi:ribonuclease R